MAYEIMIIIKQFNIKTVNVIEFDAFVDQSNNGTLFHKASFFLYHDTPKSVSFFEFYYKNKKVASCIGSFQASEFKSPFAASYGGFCWASNVRFAVQEDVIQGFETELKNQGVKKITFVHAPLTYQKFPDQSTEFLFLYRKYVQDQTLISSVINLEEFSFDGCSSISQKNYTVSADKNIKITFESTENLEEAYQILLKNKEKFKLKPTHSLKELQKLSELFPGKIEFINAFVNQVMIGSIVNFITNARTVLAFYISTDYDYNEYMAVNYMLMETCFEYKRRGFKSYDLGVSMETDTDNPMDPRRSLIFFKGHFMARGELRPRFIKELI